LKPDNESHERFGGQIGPTSSAKAGSHLPERICVLEMHEGVKNSCCMPIPPWLNLDSCTLNPEPNPKPYTLPHWRGCRAKRSPNCFPTCNAELCIIGTASTVNKACNLLDWFTALQDCVFLKPSQLGKHSKFSYTPPPKAAETTANSFPMPLIAFDTQFRRLRSKRGHRTLRIPACLQLSP